ncbi:hypothetical protein Vretimale_3443, partial [Volvox reticuliferus]
SGREEQLRNAAFVFVHADVRQAFNGRSLENVEERGASEDGEVSPSQPGEAEKHSDEAFESVNAGSGHRQVVTAPTATVVRGLYEALCTVGGNEGVEGDAGEEGQGVNGLPHTDGESESSVSGDDEDGDDADGYLGAAEMARLSAALSRVSRGLTSTAAVTSMVSSVGGFPGWRTSMLPWHDPATVAAAVIARQISNAGARPTRMARSPATPSSHACSSSSADATNNGRSIVRALEGTLGSEVRSATAATAAKPASKLKSLTKALKAMFRSSKKKANATGEGRSGAAAADGGTGAPSSGASSVAFSGFDVASTFAGVSEALSALEGLGALEGFSMATTSDAGMSGGTVATVPPGGAGSGSRGAASRERRRRKSLWKRIKRKLAKVMGLIPRSWEVEARQQGKPAAAAREGAGPES